MDDALRQLRAIIRQKSLRIGEFTLSSGKRSSYYLDCRMTTLDPTGALLIGRLMLDCIRKRNIQADAIGGFAVSGDTPPNAGAGGRAPLREAPSALFFSERNKISRTPKINQRW